ncbi:collagen alpha-1(III) chain-like [Hyaena hyaena]|uniref:collagen alpha-1(III) chain-like n=1 Tax=Hyaena hyaena TaxID=95912 RepID=UPI0019229FE1|nr:collagen alpha-1(III) chain-like [Hyaena hyaena]
MALPGPPEPPRGAPRKAPSLLEMGALCLDSEIILGFTSHLLRRRAKVRAGRPDARAAEAPSRDFAARLPRPRARRGEGARAAVSLGGSVLSRDSQQRGESSAGTPDPAAAPGPAGLCAPGTRCGFEGRAAGLLAGDGVGSAPLHPGADGGWRPFSFARWGEMREWKSFRPPGQWKGSGGCGIAETRGARGLSSLGAESARRPAGGARATGSPRPRPPSPTRGFWPCGGLDPQPPAPHMAATLRAGLEREQPVAELGGDLSAGDKQAINSAAKFPSARPADNRSRAHPGAGRAASPRPPGARRAHAPSCTRAAAKTRVPLADWPRERHPGAGTPVPRPGPRHAHRVRRLHPKGGARGALRSREREGACAQVYRDSHGGPSAPPSGRDSPNRSGSSEREGPRGDEGPLPHAQAGGGLGRGGTAFLESGSPAPPPPRPRPAPPSPPLHARRSRCRALCSHSPAPPTSERRAGPWGCRRVGSRSSGDPGEPSRPAAPSGLPASRPWAAAAPRCARHHPRYARPGPETESGTPGTLAGCAAPPGGRAWSGTLGSPGLPLGGTPTQPSRDGGRGRAAGSRPALLTLSLHCGAGARRDLEPPVAEGGPAREQLQLLEMSPRKRLPNGPEQDPRGSRPAPEGAGPGAERGHLAGGGGWCHHCHTKLAELKRQAWKLVGGPGTPLRSPSLPARSGPCPALISLRLPGAPASEKSAGVSQHVPRRDQSLAFLFCHSECPQLSALLCP